jgi:uncharacterized membrane protein
LNDVIIARAVHVLAIVLWIGGAGFVTTVVLPALRAGEAQGRLVRFEAIEERFSWQARVTTLVAGLSGFYMTARLDLWDRFVAAGFWWIHAMVALWLLFTLMLFVAEPCSSIVGCAAGRRPTRTARSG